MLAAMSYIPSEAPAAGWDQILAYMAFCETFQGQSPGAAFTGDFGVTTCGDMGVAVLSAAASVVAVLRKPAGRLAMTAIIGSSCQEGLIGFVWVDWVLYIDFLLRTLENTLGVQALVGFWDPAGFVADGSIENLARRHLQKQAKEKTPCIAFIDEIEEIVHQRGAGMGGGNNERERALNQILNEMDDFEGKAGVIVVAATNRADVLDQALLRPGRFDRRVEIGPPDGKGREQILKVHIGNKKLAGVLVLTDVAKRTAGRKGADLEDLMNESATLTAWRGKDAITWSGYCSEYARIKLIDIPNGFGALFTAPGTGWLPIIIFMGILEVINRQQDLEEYTGDYGPAIFKEPASGWG
eukprot:7681708-Heterocapsa_arctica.AAC.1